MGDRMGSSPFDCTTTAKHQLGGFFMKGLCAVAPHFVRKPIRRMADAQFNEQARHFHYSVTSFLTSPFDCTIKMAISQRGGHFFIVLWHKRDLNGWVSQAFNLNSIIACDKNGHPSFATLA